MTHVGTLAERRDTERVKSKFLFVLVDTICRSSVSRHGARRHFRQI